MEDPPHGVERTIVLLYIVITVHFSRIVHILCAVLLHVIQLYQI